MASLPRSSWLSLLLLVAAGMHFGHIEGTALFIVSGLALLGLVTIISQATEAAAVHLGPMLGGLLNATFGNVTELIIALIALKEGHYEMVRASVSGSIIGNLLFVLGLSMLLGGLRYKKQTFSSRTASTNLLMLALCLIAIVTPTLTHLGPAADPSLTAESAERLTTNVSLAVSIVLLLMYGFSLVFSLYTHRFVFRPEPSEEAVHMEEAAWSLRTSILVLLAVTVAVAFASEFFVDSLDYMMKVQKLPISELFVGVVIVAVVGNAAEAVVAVSMARKNHMELSFQICMGAAIQVALVTAPVLVIASFVIGKPMTLVFNAFEIAAIWAGVMVANLALQDGESNWFEGAMFLGVYAIFVMVFWFHP